MTRPALDIRTITAVVTVILLGAAILVSGHYGWLETPTWREALSLFPGQWVTWGISLMSVGFAALAAQFLPSRLYWVDALFTAACALLNFLLGVFFITSTVVEQGNPTISLLAFYLSFCLMYHALTTIIDQV